MRLTPWQNVPVAHRLQQVRVVAPAAVGGERLRADDRPAVGVRGGGHRLGGRRIAAAPGEQIGKRSVAPRPEFADRACRRRRRTRGCRCRGGRRPRWTASCRALRQFAQPAGVVVADHLAHGRPHVPEEPLGQLRAADDAPGEHRQPRAQVVAAPRAEFGRERGGPVLAAGLPAVDVDIGQRPAGGRPGAVEDLSSGTHRSAPRCRPWPSRSHSSPTAACGHGRVILKFEAWPQRSTSHWPGGASHVEPAVRSMRPVRSTTRSDGRHRIGRKAGAVGALGRAEAGAVLDCSVPGCDSARPPAMRAPGSPSRRRRGRNRSSRSPPRTCGSISAPGRSHAADTFFCRPPASAGPGRPAARPRSPSRSSRASASRVRGVMCGPPLP